ncbi:MAG TPA: hypothetical protein VM888_09195 [Chitinophagaceae bacterium]|nr:hypothetical protein [Chitinophagaceae bacterium]
MRNQILRVGKNKGLTFTVVALYQLRSKEPKPLFLFPLTVAGWRILLYAIFIKKDYEMMFVRLESFCSFKGIALLYHKGNSGQNETEAASKRFKMLHRNL